MQKTTTETRKEQSRQTDRSSLQIGKRAFIQAVLILFALMMAAGVLTRAVSAGSYDRVVEAGRERVVPGSYTPTEAEPPPVWRWFTAPAEVLWGADALTVNSIIILLVLISGAFHILEAGGVLKAILDGVVARFRRRKYLLMALVMFFFMFAASVLGIYEGMVPMVVIVVPLAHILGWDSLTGLGMSLLAMAFGFSAAVTNPFTIGVAQKIAGLPLFSGAWLRVIFFICVYAVLYFFVRAHAKKVERKPQLSPVYEEDREVKELYLGSGPEETEETYEMGMYGSGGGAGSGGVRGEGAGGDRHGYRQRMRRAGMWVVGWIGFAIAFVLVSSRFEAIAFLSFPAMGLLFFVAGVGGGLVAGMSGKEVARTFGKGTLSILPAILLILMAMSVKHIIAGGGIMDTILHRASGIIRGTDPFAAALLIYLLTMVLNFFVASASAKAFLMMPILAPLADLVGITRQTAVLAFDFGDGFSNMLYPSNALLLIALGFTVVSYPKWIRWTLPVQGIILGLIALFLFIAVRIGFGPF